MWKHLIVVCALLAASAEGSAQAPRDALRTPPGLELGGQVAHYRYEEPRYMSLTGNRVAGVAAFTFASASSFHARLDARLSYGLLSYAGSGTISDVPDTLAEARAIVGYDRPVGTSVTLAPYAGIGYRYLYNDLRGVSSTGAAGYRRYSSYLYAPLGLAARVRVGADWVLAPAIEYDLFLRGTQYSRLSDIGAGYYDVSNTQKRGYGARAQAMIGRGRWAMGPWIHIWRVDDSDIRPIGRGQNGMEPANRTLEYGIEARVRF